MCESHIWVTKEYQELYPASHQREIQTTQGLVSAIDFSMLKRVCFVFRILEAILCVLNSCRTCFAVQMCCYDGTSHDNSWWILWWFSVDPAVNHRPLMANSWFLTRFSLKILQCVPNGKDLRISLSLVYIYKYIQNQKIAYMIYVYDFNGNTDITRVLQTYAEEWAFVGGAQFFCSACKCCWMGSPHSKPMDYTVICMVCNLCQCKNYLCITPSNGNWSFVTDCVLPKL